LLPSPIIVPGLASVISRRDDEVLL
jgi:hypothetical protein